MMRVYTNSDWKTKAAHHYNPKECNTLWFMKIESKDI